MSEDFLPTLFPFTFYLILFSVFAMLICQTVDKGTANMQGFLFG